MKKENEEGTNENRARLRTLCKLLSYFEVHAIGDHSWFLPHKDFYERVIHAMKEDGEKRGATVTELDGGLSVALNGEFRLQEILKMCVTNLRKDAPGALDQF